MLGKRGARSEGAEKGAEGKGAKESARQETKLVREAAPRPLGAGDCAASMAGIAALALASGLAIGSFAWAMLHLWMLLVRLIWTNGAQALNCWFYPVIVGAAGGALIGLWNRATHSYPKPLNAVIAGIKNGGYRVRSLAAGSVAFLMPLAFGGSIGPAAGLVGLIATACSRMSEMLVRAGLRSAAAVDAGKGKMMLTALTSPFHATKSHAERAREKGYAYSRKAKILLYSLVAAAAVAAVAMLARFVGWWLIVPRFAFSMPSWESLLGVLPLVLCGYGLALLSRMGGGAGGALSCKLAAHSVWVPVICGLVLGCAATFLPNVMFTGQAQTVEVMASWAGVSAVLLLATGMVKAFATPFCIAAGWCGGPFYPLIFAAVSFGYGAASLFGLDPVLCASVVATSLLVTATRKPALVLVLLMICFPLRDLVWMLPAALIALVIPLPKALKQTQAVEVS